MIRSLVAALSLIGNPTLAATPPVSDNPERPTVEVRVDSARREFVITSGPFDLPNMPPMDDQAMMDHGTSHDTPLQRVEWPIDGWFRGFRIALHDRAGRPLPRRIMHHLIMVNFDRRQLLYSAAERLMGAGQETVDASVPKTIGVPMKPGTRLGFYVAWHNDTGQDLEDVYLKLTLLWTPKNQVPQPVHALPIYMDVNLTVGGTNTFDVPAGQSTKAYEFTLPVSGRLLGISGHIHDYGSAVRLQDVESGKIIAQVLAKRDSNGKVASMARKLFGVSGEGLKLEANRRYRVIAEYDNPTGELRLNGGMASIVGLFAPDDLDRWPKIDLGDETMQRDLASLENRGTPVADEHSAHSEHSHSDE